MTTSYLTLQDLKARGWTLGMIRTLLGSPDHERWTNKLGHHVSKPISLFLELRVVDLERTEAFTHAQVRANHHQALMVKAYQTRRRAELQSVSRYETLVLPAVHVSPLRGALSAAHQLELWELHLREFYVWQRQQEHLLSGVTQAQRRGAQRRMLQRYQAAVNHAYGWSESSH